MRINPTDPVRAATRHEYDGAGRLVAVIDALGNVQRLRTDAAGLPSAVTDALDGYLAAGLTTADDGTVELSCRPDYEADVYLGAIGSGAWEAAPTITTRCRLLRLVMASTVRGASSDRLGGFVDSAESTGPNGRFRPT